MIFFTADNHFDHTNVIKYCNRPFESTEEMNYEMIFRWNSKVSEKDIVYHLGDFTLGNKEIAIKFFSQLNGNIIMVNNKFHHDQRWMSMDSHTINYYTKNSKVIIQDSIIYTIVDSKYIVMAHFPLEEWNRKHYGSIHLHGHSHGNCRKIENRFDVGVDCFNFYPVTLDEIK